MIIDDQHLMDVLNSEESFKTSHDIPIIPVISKQELNDIVIPNLIRRGAIPKSKLLINHLYYGKCRNNDYALWVGKHFIIKRYKFGIEFDEKINHFEDDDNSDFFIPIEDKGEVKTIKNEF